MLERDSTHCSKHGRSGLLLRSPLISGILALLISIILILLTPLKCFLPLYWSSPIISVTSPHPPNIRLIIYHYISYITSYFYIINIISHFISYITSLPPFTSGMYVPLHFFLIRFSIVSILFITQPFYIISHYIRCVISYFIRCLYIRYLMPSYAFLFVQLCNFCCPFLHLALTIARFQIYQNCMLVYFLCFRDLTTLKVDVGGLLTKYARASMMNGIKVFSSRKPVTWH